MVIGFQHVDRQAQMYGTRSSAAGQLPGLLDFRSDVLDSDHAAGSLGDRGCHLGLWHGLKREGMLPICRRGAAEQQQWGFRHQRDVQRRKTVGESGTGAAPAALMNAVNDALRPFNSYVTDQPMTPETILQALGKV